MALPVSPSASGVMIITCPHCQTKYQVTYEAIGSVGRKVQCAHCQQAWQQGPISPQEPVSPADQAAIAAVAEDGLDEAMEAEEKAIAAEVAKRLGQDAARKKPADPKADKKKAKADSADGTAGQIDPSVVRSRQRAFTRRHNAMLADQPMARLRRVARVGLSLVLSAILAGGYFARVQVVEHYPAMAGLYEAVGLGVNVVGLEFSNVSTTRTLRDGKEVLIVSAQIVGLMSRPTLVPAVVVTLIDSAGRGVYQWSVTPSVRDLMAGERATFDTQLTLPPGDASRVRLSFAGGAGLDPQKTQAADTKPAAEAAAHSAAEPAHPIPEHH